MGISFCKPVSDPLIFAIDSVQFSSAGKIAGKLINLVLFGFSIHVIRDSLVEDLVGPADLLLELLARQLVNRLFVLPLCFNVLHGRQILFRSFVNDFLDPLEVLLILFGLLGHLELVVRR